MSEQASESPGCRPGRRPSNSAAGTAPHCSARTVALSVLPAGIVTAPDVGLPLTRVTAGLGLTPATRLFRWVRSAGGAVMIATPAAAVLAVFLTMILCTTFAPPFTVARLIELVMVSVLRRALLGVLAQPCPAARGARAAAAKRASTEVIFMVGWSSRAVWFHVMGGGGRIV